MTTPLTNIRITRVLFIHIRNSVITVWRPSVHAVCVCMYSSSHNCRGTTLCHFPRQPLSHFPEIKRAYYKVKRTLHDPYLSSQHPLDEKHIKNRCNCFHMCCSYHAYRLLICFWTLRDSVIFNDDGVMHVTHKIWLASHRCQTQFYLRTPFNQLLKMPCNLFKGWCLPVRQKNRTFFLEKETI